MKINRFKKAIMLCGAAIAIAPVATVTAVNSNLNTQTVQASRYPRKNLKGYFVLTKMVKPKSYSFISNGVTVYQAGDVIKVERLDAEVNSKVTFEPLMIGDEKGSTFGNPTVSGASVTATVVEHGKGKKVQLAIYKKMNGHHRAQGHRQPYSKIKIDAIKK